jgi:hypothetical protein
VGEVITWRYRLREQQRDLVNGIGRFNVWVCHRRFGKTVVAVLYLIKVALACKLRDPQVHYYAPTYGQAKKIAWKYVKAFTDKSYCDYNEAELKCTFRSNGATLELGSAKNPDASRGIYSDFLVMDEPARYSPRMWDEVLRPALSDRKGGCIAIGTPQGRHGLFHDLWIDGTGQWNKQMFKASETGIIDPVELDSARLAMSESSFRQEYECSFDAAIRGSYYGAIIEGIEEKQITSVPHTPELLVHTSWDLGINDATAIWFWQVYGMEHRAINYTEYENTALPEIVRDLRENPKYKGYQYGKHIVPPDVNVRSLSTGQKRSALLRKLGLELVEAPKVHVADGIEAVKTLLPKVWFDETNCKHGIECMRQYRADWIETREVLSLNPVHDWTSHGADSMRYYAVTPATRLSGSFGGELDYSKMDHGNRARGKRRR